MPEGCVDETVPSELTKSCRQSVGMKRFWNNASSEWRKNRNKAVSTGISKYYSDLSSEERKRRAEISRQNFRKGADLVVELHKDFEWKKWWSERNWNGLSSEEKERRIALITTHVREYWNNLSMEDRKVWLQKTADGRASIDNVEVGSRIGKAVMEYWKSLSHEERRRFGERVSCGMKEWWSSLTTEERQERLENSFNSIETRKKIREAIQAFWKDNSEARERQSQILQQYWDNLSEEERKARLQRMIRSWQVKPTIPELAVLNYLHEKFPDRWMYNGDGGGAGVVAGKIPDFVEVNGNGIIEVFGGYWHFGEDSSDKVVHYRKHGYDCLILWESECYDGEVLDSRIMEFVKRRG